MRMHPLTHITKSFTTRSKQKFSVYLICLALSIFLWFLNSLEKKYSDHLTVPVRYVNLPKNKELSGYLPRKLEMTVDASGYTILQYKLSLFFTPLQLDVNELTDGYLQSKFMTNYQVSLMRHKEEFQRQISNELQIINIQPDTLNFDVRPLSDRKIKINPRVKLSFLKEFTTRQAPFTSPDSVWIHGPQHILDTMKYIRTEAYELRNLSQNFLQEVKLDLPKGITSKIKKVLLNVQVEQFTEAAFEIPVSVINAPDSLTIKLFPAKIKVSCRVGLSEYANLTKNSFKAYVNFNNSLLSMTKLPVQLGPFPTSILSAEYFPREVEYVIEYK